MTAPEQSQRDPYKRPPAFTDWSYTLLLRYRELLLEYGVAPTTLVDLAQAAALERLIDEIERGLIIHFDRPEGSNGT